MNTVYTIIVFAQESRDGRAFVKLFVDHLPPVPEASLHEAHKPIIFVRAPLALHQARLQNLVEEKSKRREKKLEPSLMWYHYHSMIL